MNWQWLRHAFAIEPPGPAEPTTAQQAAVDKICLEINRRGMSTPALAFLETFRPLNLIAAQSMQFFSPLLSTITDSRVHTEFAAFLERRGSIEHICRRIEELETIGSPD